MPLFPVAVDGAAVLVEPGEIDHWHAGIPFTSDGYVVTGPPPITHYHGGLPFNEAGQLVTRVWPAPPP